MLSSLLDGNLPKTLAALFLFTVALGASFVYGYDAMLNITPPTPIVGFISLAIGFSLTVLGYSHGVSTVTNATDKATTQTLPAAVNIVKEGVDVANKK